MYAYINLKFMCMRFNSILLNPFVDFCDSDLRATNVFPLNNGILLLHPLEQQRILWGQSSKEQDLWYKIHIKASVLAL